MITSLYAGILSILFFWISLETIKARGREQISLGAGENNQIIHLVSAHSNFASYVPLLLFLMYLLEVKSFNSVFLHFTGVIVVTGRILHFLTMRNKETTFKKRKLGMQLTLFPLLWLGILNAFIFLF